MSLEDLEKEIYDFKGRKKEKEPQHKIQEPASEQEQVRAEWEEEKPSPFLEKIKSLAKVFLIGGIFVGIVAVSVFFILKNSGEARGVSIEIYNPNDVYKGVPFDVNIQIGNDIDSFLQDASLTVKLTPGLEIIRVSESAQGFFTERLGDIGGGSLTKKTYRVLAKGNPHSLQKITVQLSYKTGARAVFEIEESKEINIGNPAISLEVIKPEQFLAGSKFSFDIAYQNISSADFSDVTLEAEYPPAFRFDSASIEPSSLNNFWELGEVKAGSRGSIRVTGTLENLEEGSVSIPVKIATSIFGKEIAIAESAGIFSPSPSPISLSVLVDDRSDYVAGAGEGLRYQIKYQNNSGIALVDVVIEAAFSGEMFNFQTIRTKGGFDSSKNTVTWNAANTPELRFLDPASSGTVYVEIGLKNSFPIRSTLDKNYDLTVSVKMDSPSVPYYLKAERTSAFLKNVTKVKGDIAVDAKALYRDPESGIINAGSLPPKVNEPTQYTIRWIIRNFSTDVSSVEVTAFLESGVRWTGIVKSNIGSVPLYNERTQEVIWKIDSIPATRGVLGTPVETIFQIEATPNITQVGNHQPLVTRTSIKAIDDFTGVRISSSDEELTTRLDDDPTVQFTEGKVIR